MSAAEPHAGPPVVRTSTQAAVNFRVDARLLIACALLIPILSLVLLGPFFYSESATEGDLLQNLAPPKWVGSSDSQGLGFESSGGHVLGTDNLGRDVLARAMYGGRVSLGVTGLAVLLGGLIGVLMGLIAGYFEGLIGAVVMRLVDVQLSIPVILLAAMLVIGLGPGLRTTVIALSVTSWVDYARLVRGQVLAYKGKEYLDSARVIGAGHPRMILRYVLPGVGSLIAVVTTVSVSHVLLLESGLTFLGFGIQPPLTSWGGQLGEGVSYLNVAWWLSVVPGVLLMLTVLGVNLLGDWGRDRLDPRGQRLLRRAGD